MPLSNKLKEARMKKGLKQEDLAKALGKSKGVISHWERGDNRPDADTLFDICELLEVDPNWLLDWEQRSNVTLSLAEQEILEKFNALTPHDQSMVHGFINRLLDLYETGKRENEKSSE